MMMAQARDLDTGGCAPTADPRSLLSFALYCNVLLSICAPEADQMNTNPPVQLTANFSISTREQSPHPAQGLFSHKSVSIAGRQRKRPLGLLSDFVTDELPHRVAEIRCSEQPNEAVRLLGRSINAILSKADYDAQLLSLPQSDFGIAKTDIHYLVNCLYQMSAFAGLNPMDAGRTVGDPLNRLARLSCQQQPSIDVLSYEDVILTNPLQSDPRLYCLGAAGVEERDFCLGHQLIEGDLQSAMDALLELRDTLDVDARQCLTRCLKHLDSAIYVLTRFHERMSLDLFGHFRAYYVKNPYKNRLGPSGRFSARMVAVSVLLMGEELFHQSLQFYRDIYRLSDHYPQACIREVFRWLVPDNGSGELDPTWLEGGEAAFPRSATVSSAVERHGYEIGKLRASCVRALDQFTRMHRNTALKYTIEPGHSVSGAEAEECVEAILCQRLLTARY
ncbi:hypothetical protein ABIF38_000236 [Bradyrhizobium japonicum]|nr:hypothetical protein BEL01nite_81150 [Bradyrhizobium elkanii]